ncbi:MAG TPA: methyltransferase domain-containing protein [Anaerolineae bacterium]|nr:methyltransferase domain-containing protein [Anaerolineae bacterium]
MTKASRSFDRAADYYDQTRELPEPIATHGIPALLQYIAPHGKILDVGTGTGRISVPLLRLGADVIGVDLSLNMMGKLREKYSTAHLAQADASRLPFATQRFDAVLTTHVMHLIGPWREALREYRRVLKPGGVYIDSTQWHDNTSLLRRIRDHWRELVEAQGAQWRRPGAQSPEEITAELQALGARVEEVEVLRYYSTSTPREVLEAIHSRVCSDAWDVPDHVFETTYKEITVWTKQEFKHLDEPISTERRFVLRITRFD